MDVWLARAPFLEQVPWVLLALLLVLRCPLVDRAAASQERLALERLSKASPTALVPAPQVAGGRRRLSEQVHRL